MAKTLAKPATAGFEEKNDMLVQVAPNPGKGIEVELTSSPVIKQYGKHIVALIEKIAKDAGFSDVKFQVIDKGAWDYTIEARVVAALERGMQA